MSFFHQNVTTPSLDCTPSLEANRCTSRSDTNTPLLVTSLEATTPTVGSYLITLDYRKVGKYSILLIIRIHMFVFSDQRFIWRSRKQQQAAITLEQGHY